MTGGLPRPRTTDGALIAGDFASFRARAEADPDVLGLVLMGSRGYGAHVGDASDYDVLVVVGRDPEPWRSEHGASVESWPMTIERFRSHGLPGDRDAWNRPAFLGVRILLDRSDGEITRLVEAKRVLAPDEARMIGATSLDAYLNSLYRSLRNLEAGRSLEGRLDALESIDPLLTTSFALEGRVRPFNKWLRQELRSRPLALLDVLSLADELSARPDVEAQRRVFRRVEEAARLAGCGDVVDSWEPDVDWLRGKASGGDASRGEASRG